jgi:hypothetical protein
MTTGFPGDRDHAPIDSEIFALLDSIKAQFIIRDGIVTVVTKYGDTWNFTVPVLLVPAGPKDKNAYQSTTSTAYKALFETPAHEAHLVKRKNPQA